MLKTKKIINCGLLWCVDVCSRGYCKICDVALPIRFSDHQRLTFHRVRLENFFNFVFLTRALPLAIMLFDQGLIANLKGEVHVQ